MKFLFEVLAEMGAMGVRGVRALWPAVAIVIASVPPGIAIVWIALSVYWWCRDAELSLDVALMWAIFAGLGAAGVLFGLAWWIQEAYNRVLDRHHPDEPSSEQTTPGDWGGID